MQIIHADAQHAGGIPLLNEWPRCHNHMLLHATNLTGYGEILTAPQAVFAATAGSVAVAVGLVVAGVAVLAGVGWALIAAGALLGPTAAAAAVVLLRDDGSK